MEMLKQAKGGSGYQRCLVKAMDRTHQLLLETDAVRDSEKIHSAKSILYAAIEQAGIESERLISAQELLRELLTLVSLQGDPVRQEKQEALDILAKLRRGKMLNPMSQI